MKDVLETAESLNISYEKYFNEDINLLEQNLTEQQFSRIETKFKKDKRLVSSKVGEDDSFFKKHSIDVSLYKPASLDEVDDLVKKFIKVDKRISVPTRHSNLDTTIEELEA